MNDVFVKFCRCSGRILVMLLTLVALLSPIPQDAYARSKKPKVAATDYCDQTADLLKIACLAETTEEDSIGSAACLNISDLGQRRRCDRRVQRNHTEAVDGCDASFKARKRLCRLVGQDRYSPNFSAENFIDPRQIGVTIEPNPYFPLKAGNGWVYRSGDEEITISVTTSTKQISGVTCVVVTDVVTKAGQPTEITDDWFAQDTQGNVWYCGENTGVYETIVGDAPQQPELVSIEGAWKAGRDQAQPGIVMFRNPTVGVTYRQEQKLADAEDAARVQSITGTESSPAGSCTGTCLVTREFTPLDPGNFELKYYAPGIGQILEIEPDGTRTELVEFRH